MVLLIKIYSGIFLYLSNSSIQESKERGGKIPKTGSHSVIDSPESEILVAPPTKTRMINRKSSVDDQITSDRFVFFLVSINLNLFI